MKVVLHLHQLISEHHYLEIMIILDIMVILQEQTTSIRQSKMVDFGFQTIWYLVVMVV